MIGLASSQGGAYLSGMTFAEAAVVALEVFVAAVALTGIFARRWWPVCLAFPFYLGCFIASEAAILAYPQRFFALDFWLAKEALQAFVKLFLACEIAFRVFERLPAARRRVGISFLFVLTATGVSVALVGGDSVATIVGLAMPRVQYGTAMLFVIVAGACLWYHVPVPGLPKAVLAGFSVYLFAFSGVLHALETWGWDLRGTANLLNTAAFLSVLLYWTSVAWTRAEDVSIAAPVSSWLPLWASPRHL